LSYDEWAKFIFIHQSVTFYWSAFPIFAAVANIQRWNGEIPELLTRGNPEYTSIIPDSSNNTVTVREIWEFKNLDGDSSVVRTQMESVSKFEMILSAELRGALPRSYTLRRLEYHTKRFYPGSSAFPDRKYE
jgi:hypothetical protein